MVRELTLVDDIARTIDPNAFVIWRDKHGVEVPASTSKNYRQAKAICTAAEVIKQLSYLTPDALLEALEDDEIARMQDVVENVAKDAEAEARQWDDFGDMVIAQADEADTAELTNKTSAAHAAAMGTPINAAEK